MIIAIIPARGGSKRIPKKNIKDFCGKPMIGWSIQAAKESNIFDQIIVSTDDVQIAKIASDLGATAPFLRPPELSNDYVGTGPVVKHALEWCMKNLGEVKSICTIYATAPFLEASDIKEGYELLCNTESDITFTVTNYLFPIQRALKLNKLGRVEMFQPEHFHSRSQDLEAAFHDAGQIYWATPDAILNELSAFNSGAVAQFLPSYKVQDIDNQDDWRRAELMFKAWHSDS